MRYEPIIHRLAERQPFDLEWRQGVLLRSTNWLGDALMTLPASWQISRCIPSCCGFFVLAPKGLAPLWEACPWVNCVIPMSEKRISDDEAINARLMMAGVGVVFPNSFGSAWDMTKCGTGQIVGRAGRFRSFLLTHRIPEWQPACGKAECHQLSYYLDLASALGKIEYSTHYPPLNVDLNLVESLGISSGNWLAIAPGAAFGPAKQWMPEYFLKVAQWYSENRGRVVFVGTKKEAEVVEKLCSQITGALNLAGRTSLYELMAVLSRAEAAVANDSGAMHLAAAVGTSGVAVFGSTDNIATGPIGAPWHLIVSDAECRPCFKRTCPLPENSYNCLRNILPEQVITELKEILS